MADQTLVIVEVLDDTLKRLDKRQIHLSKKVRAMAEIEYATFYIMLYMTFAIP